MKATANNKHRKWLRRAGLIVGLVGAGGLTLFILATTETPFTQQINNTKESDVR